jgi:hypothetical protein
MAEPTQKELEQMVNPTTDNRKAVFFEKAVLNREKSVVGGERFYDTAVYVKIKAPGITDWIANRAMKEDFKEYATEYEHFLKNKQGDRPPGVDIIPGLGIENLQRCIDMGLNTIPKLAAAKNLPLELEKAQQAAVAINVVWQEQTHGKEENNEENSNQRESTQTDIKRVFEADRRNDPDGDGQSVVSTSDSGRNGYAPKRLQESGRIHGSQGVDTFNYNFTLKTRQ